MQRKLGNKFLAMVVMVFILTSLLTVVVNDDGDSIDSIKEESDDIDSSILEDIEKSEGPNFKNSAFSDEKINGWQSKLSSDVKDMVGDKFKYTTVMVSTTNTGKLNRVLRKIGGSINVDIEGNEENANSNFDYSSLSYEDKEHQMVTRTVDVPADSIEDIAKLESVVEVFQKPEIKTMDMSSEENQLLAGRGDGPTTSEVEGEVPYSSSQGTPEKTPEKSEERKIASSIADVHQAPDAWEKGYRGEGKNIAIVDTGTDFAHADLVNQWAVAPEGNYSGAGWPVMFDPGSMNSYLTTNKTDVNRTLEGGYPVGYQDGSQSRYSQTNFTFSPTDEPLTRINESVIRRYDKESEGQSFWLRGDGIYQGKENHRVSNVSSKAVDDDDEKIDESEDPISELQNHPPDYTPAKSSTIKGDGWYTLDSTSPSGEYSSLELDSNGHPHISFYDGTLNELKYSYYDGTTWTTETVDDEGDVGKYTSLALDSNGDPHISYYDVDNTSLRYAKNVTGSWNITKITGFNDNPEGDPKKIFDAGRNSSIVLDSSDSPRISFYNETTIGRDVTKDLNLARLDENDWKVERVDEMISGEEEGDVGVDSSLSVDSNDNLHLVYYNEEFGGLKYAQMEGLEWKYYTIIEGSSTQNKIGKYSSIALDDQEYPIVSYYDETNGNLKYAYADNSSSFSRLKWNISTVDNSQNVGKYTSLALTSNGKPRISYYNVSGGDLQYARWDGEISDELETKDWAFDVINPIGDAGSYNSLELNNTDHPHISYYYNTNTALKYTFYNGTVWNKTNFFPDVKGKETGEELAVTDFDPGRIGGWIHDLKLNIRYSVNTTYGEMDKWNNSEIQLINENGDVIPLEITPQDGHDDICETVDILELGMTDIKHVEDISELQVRYDLKYNGSVPGPTVSFDYIDLEYDYGDYPDVYHHKFIGNETAFVGENSTNDNYGLKYIPEYNLSGRFSVHSSHQDLVDRELAFEGNRTNQEGDTYQAKKHHIEDVSVRFINETINEVWLTKNYTVNEENGTITLDRNIPNGSKVYIKYGWDYPLMNRVYKKSLIKGNRSNQINTTIEFDKHHIKNVNIYIRENNKTKTKIWANKNDDNYTLDRMKGTLKLNTNLSAGDEIFADYGWHYMRANMVDNETAFVGNSTYQRGDVYDFNETMFNLDVYYEKGDISKKFARENYTINYEKGRMKLKKDIPNGSYVNVTYERSFFGFDPKVILNEEDGTITLNESIKNTELKVTYQGSKRWTKDLYSVEAENGELVINKKVEKQEAITATYTCGEDITQLDVSVPKSRYPANATWGQENFTAPYKVDDLPVTSQSGEYRFGLSKANHLADLWEEHVGMLIIDSEEAGVYDTVLIDIDSDFDFSDEKPVNKSSPLAFTEIESFAGGDMSDITNYEFSWSGREAEEANIGLSAGLLYWIADGNRSIPYADRYADHFDLKNVTIPDNGDLVAFYGDWDSHGTSTAANAAGTGRSAKINGNMIDYYGDQYYEFGCGGLAPEAKVIGVSMLGGGGSTEASWRFAAEGYDGKAGTGDEAHINSNSWGSLVDNSGWDYYSRLAMNISRRYPNTILVVSAGNEGNGYGTMGSPAGSPGVISVAGGTNMAYEDSFGNDLDFLYTGPEKTFPFESGEGDPRNQRPYGDIIGFSSRGPNSLGQPGVDITAAGAFGNGAFPINYAFTYESAGAPILGFELWDTTSEVMGLGIPHNNTHSFMLFSGTSLACPVTAGGAALTYQAYESAHGRPPTYDKMKDILMASADDIDYDPLQQGAGWLNTSMAVDLASRVEGAMTDQEYWSPGDYEGTSHKGMANLMERGESDDVDINFDTFGDTSISDVKPVKYDKTKNITFQMDWDLAAGYLTVTEDGEIYYRKNKNFKKPEEFGEQIDYNQTKLKEIINTDSLLKINMNQYKKGRGYVQIHNWQDENETLSPIHGQTETGGNGRYDASTEIHSPERTRMTWAMDSDGRYLNTFIRNPKDRIHEGMLLESKVPGYELSGRSNITLEVYEKAEWDWVNITKKRDNSYNAEITVPEDGQIGGHEGAILYEWDNKTSLIPMFVNVQGFPGEAGGEFQFGGGDINSTLYDNNRIGAQASFYDSRFFYLSYDLNNPPQDNDHFMAFLSFISNTTNMQMNLYGESFSRISGGDYGSFSMDLVKDSEISTDPTKTMIYLSDYLRSKPNGLMLLEVRCNAVGNATSYGEPLNGTMGHMKIYPSDFTRYNSPEGDEEFTIKSSFTIPDGVEALLPEAEEESEKGVDITHHPYDEDEYGTDFISYLADAPDQQEIRVPKGAFTFSFDIDGRSENDDYDLGLFLDGSGEEVPEPDGEAQPDEFVEYSAVPGADEGITLLSPEQGNYICKIAGYEVDSGVYDYSSQMYLPGTSPFEQNGVPNYTFNPETSNEENFNISWYIPHSNRTGTLQSKIFLSPSLANLSLTQTLTPRLIFDDEKPNISDVEPLNGTRTNDNKPLITADYHDIGDSGIEMNYTRLFVDDEEYILGLKSYRDGLEFSPDEEIEDGKHLFKINVGDKAGNNATYMWNLTIDTEPPSIDVSTISDGDIIKSESVPVAGRVSDDTKELYMSVVNEDTGRHVIDERNVSLNNVSFSEFVKLKDEGRYRIDLQAIDKAENENETSFEIERDTTKPEISILKPSSTTDLVSLDEYQVVGKVDEQSEEMEVSINGMDATLHADGTFMRKIPLSEGMNDVKVSAVDGAGNKATVSRSIRKDTTSPNFAWWDVDVEEDIATVSGQVNEEAKVYINGDPVKVDDNRFEEELELRPNSENRIFVTAVDDVGNTAQESQTLDLGGESSEESVNLEDSGSSDSSIDIGLILGMMVLGVIIGVLIAFALMTVMGTGMGTGTSKSEQGEDVGEGTEETWSQGEEFEENEEEYIWEEAEDVEEDKD